MKHLNKIILWLVVFYAVLVTGRIIYVLNVPEPEPVYQSDNYTRPSFSSTATVRNYAKVMFKTPAGHFQIGQTYEKIAEIYNSTQDFVEDEKKLRAILLSEEALIQKEQVSGKPGNRSVIMAIGVYPDKFDGTVEKLKALGVNEQFTVTKTDRTNEYRKLRAEKGSLEERKKSMMLLKGRNGKVEELIALENKIYDIVKEIHALDLSIGEFEGVKDFCTISFSIAETGLKPVKANKIAESFDWAFGKLILIIVTVFFALLGLFVLIKIVDALRPKPVDATPPPASKYDVPVQNAEVKQKGKRGK